MARYDGKEPCIGCGKTGAEITRDSKNCLCPKCQEALRLGYDLIKTRRTEQTFFRLEELETMHMCYWTIPISEVHIALVNLLKQLSSFNADFAVHNYGSDSFLLSHDGVRGKDTFVIPKPVKDAVIKLCNSLYEYSTELKAKKRNCEKECEQELNKERNAIYNEGVAYGRKLLVQLNKGEIGLPEFNADVNKY